MVFAVIVVDCGAFKSTVRVENEVDVGIERVCAIDLGSRRRI